MAMCFWLLSHILIKAWLSWFLGRATKLATVVEMADHDQNLTVLRSYCPEQWQWHEGVNS